MKNTPASTQTSDPLSGISLAEFAHAFRHGHASSEATTRDYLIRIDALNAKYDAFQHVAHESAIATARAMDALRDAGVNLGPLMGVPIAIKDIFTIDGMPAPKVGSRMQLPPLAGACEGSFIQALRRAGCVFLGQTKAVELCLGITGVSAPLGTPWNPYDTQVHRVPGGSSSGSAVAVAAGLCALAIGSDSGGSVRVPAAFNGLFGLKTSWGLWPVDGAFPLDPRVDSIGLLTRSAADCMMAFEQITVQLSGLMNPPRFPAIELDRLRIGVPANYFFDGLSDEIRSWFEDARQTLRSRGVRLDDVQVPEAPEREAYFPVSMPASLIAALGPEAFQEQNSVMDPVVRARVETGLEPKAHVLLAAEERRQRSIAAVKARFDGFDAWVSPTTRSTAPAVSEFEDQEQALKLALDMTHNTQPANYLQLCAVSMPIPQDSGRLPHGLQVMAAAGNENRLLAVAAAFEQALGRQTPPRL